ncbi:unnamed protein product, partial [Mesorhabditis belari]|uniref:Uncharacterized protein n=1 Tax=Mesorhabditis belari TaxID=2138241 RepID=A0AAF3ENB3_9BILA
MRLVFSFLYIAFLLSGVAAQGKHDKDNRSSIKTIATTISTISTISTTTTTTSTTTNVTIKTNTIASTASTLSNNTTTTNFNGSTTINGTIGMEINNTSSTKRTQVDIGSDGHPASKVGMQIALSVGIPIILIIFVCVIGYCGWKLYKKSDNLRSLPFIKNLGEKVGEGGR